MSSIGSDINGFAPTALREAIRYLGVPPGRTEDEVVALVDKLRAEALAQAA